MVNKTKQIKSKPKKVGLKELNNRLDSLESNIVTSLGTIYISYFKIKRRIDRSENRLYYLIYGCTFFIIANIILFSGDETSLRIWGFLAYFIMSLFFSVLSAMEG